MSLISLVYCTLSLALFSGFLTTSLSTRLLGTSLPPQESTSLAHLLSKASPLLSPPTSLDPNVLSTKLDENPPLSACLWITEDEVELVPRWAERWTGPISLLITTPSPRGSARHKALLSALFLAQKRHPSLRRTLVAHVLHAPPNAEPHPNALLNLARLLAPSATVALFPANLSATAPPKTLFRSLSGPLPHADANAHRTGGEATATVLTRRGRASFPFAAGAPLVLPRDAPTWCTERFFGGGGGDGGAREREWEQCLWQVWLAAFGEVGVRQTQGWTALGRSEETRAGERQEGGVAERLQERLVGRFRSETCALAIRRFSALRDLESSVDTKRMRWLKRTCRSWMS
ncbi:uncharacterized protein BXZ73DRAFT_97756 [Epithele typhae]|uniref:uncharacterized protein n=1 Tax=Epithele typhae TaxID=378194 RepID=UPI0020082FA0|nr:uncharacterized protein BXZ73DRAFT_97756 [Epithele typhae]KAH9942343.1 hypothetical protein BXZ73DRAFT_97756 [Epithele typhae]